MRRFMLIIMITSLSGCASTKLFFPLNPQSDSEAIVHFIRPNIIPTAFPIQIFVDGKKAAALSNWSEVSFSIPIGEHEVVLDWPPGSLGVGMVKEKYVFKGGELRHFQLNDKSVIVGQTLVNGNRLSLKELTTEESKRAVRSLN